ncbi:MAG: tellurite resistance TerB family protein [Chromatiaceae bacterium]|nr:tellurite resistance TerB family protein [Chromatiaceae bacterium]
MANFGDLIGAFLQNSMTSSGSGRVGSAVDNLQRGSFSIPGMGAGGGADLLDSLRNAVQGGMSGAARNPAAAGGIGAVLGSLLGGGSDSVKGALGGGALAMLASVAMKALMSADQGAKGAAGAAPWSGGDLPLGLKVPENREQQETLRKTAELVLKGMINAAKSDGRVSREESQRIVGKLRESGLDDASQAWLLEEMQRPLDLDAFVAEIPSHEVAAQVYAASLLAIEVDTQAEVRYLQRLAQLSGLHPAVVQQIHQTMGTVT